MKLQAFSVATAARQHRVRGRLALLVAAAVLVVSSSGAAQQEAPGEPVVIPGADIPGWGQVHTVPGRFGRPADSTTPKMPAVLILHGDSGVDGRGAFYAQALQEAGLATLEIVMIPQPGTTSSMPYAAAALTWLAAQPTVDAQRLGVMGFSSGGIMSVLMASDLVQERLGPAVPKPAAFAPFYPLCSDLVRVPLYLKDPYYNAHTRMRAVPMLIQVGTRDSYETGDRPCDALVAMWPAPAREQVAVRYIEGATHGFDRLTPATQFSDEDAHAGRGGMVSMVPKNPEAAAEARQAVVRFFVTHLKP